MIIKNRLQFAFAYTPKCGKLLDIGCDYGDFSHEYLKKAKIVYALDPNDHSIKEAKKRQASKRKKVIFVKSPAEKLPFPDSSFDVVTITDAYEHVENEKKTLNEIYRVLRPGGVLVFSVPYKGWFRFIDSFNMKFYLPKIYKWWKGKDFDPKIYELAPWHRHYSLKDLKKIFKGKFVIEKKHRGGLFVWPVMWLMYDALYSKIFKKTPDSLMKVHNFISDVDYSIPYGPAAFHITLMARKI